jgi:hypothetical protein
MPQGVPGSVPMNPSQMPQGVPGSAAQNAVAPPDPATAMKNMTPEQKNMFGSMTPDQQSQFLQMLATDFAGKGAAAESDMSRADAIRQGEGPQGRFVGQNTYVAASPLEHLASGMQKYRANEDFKASRTARDSAATDSDALRKRAMEMIGGRSGLLRQ